MTRNEKILLFLGRIQARIEDLGEWASQTNNQAFHLIADLESYFNRSLQEILSTDEMENSRWPRGITWNTLPR